MKWLISILLCIAATGCCLLRPNHLCGIDEFSNFKVKVCERDGKPCLRVSGVRLSGDKTIGVSAMRQRHRDRTMHLYAYTGGFWHVNEKLMRFEVDVSQLDMVYFGDVLLWTRENGIEEHFRDIIKPFHMTKEELRPHLTLESGEEESEEKWQAFLDEWWDIFSAD